MRAVNEAKAEKIERENKWRFGYPKYIVDHVKQGMRNDGKDALTMAQAGLDFCYEKFEFVVDDHSTVSLKEAMKGDVAALSSTQFTTICTDDFISTATDTKNNNVDASGSDQQYSYTLPYQGDELTGEALVQQLDCWAEKGIIEPDTRDYIRDIALSNNLDLSGHYFTLLGATSAMGPFNILLRMNANIIAIARPSTDKWNRIFATIRDLKSRFSNVGRVYLPSSLTDGIDTLNDNGDHSVNIDQIAASAGADLMTQTPQILKWLLNDFDDEKEMLVGMYGYLDSGKHVLLTLASDAIMQGLIQRRSGAVSLAFLPSPTDVFIVPASLKLACDKNRQKAPVWQQVLSTVSSSMLNSNSSKKDNIEGTSKYAINNGLSTAQGPNYALAKRIQHWRAMLAESQDCNVSSNVAPAACTASVTSNKTFAAVYGGFHHFSPLEVMEQATAAHMMTALTLHDILVKGKAKKEGKEKSRSDVPLALFISGAFHGGIWRCGYVMDSIGAPALIMYYMSKYGVGLLALVAGAVAGTVAGVDFTAALPFTLPVLP